MNISFRPLLLLAAVAAISTCSGAPPLEEEAEGDERPRPVRADGGATPHDGGASSGGAASSTGNASTGTGSLGASSSSTGGSSSSAAAAASSGNVSASAQSAGSQAATASSSGGNMASSSAASASSTSSAAASSTSSGSGGLPAPNAEVFANTPRELYRLDVGTGLFSLVGSFQFLDEVGQPDSTATMTDIAVDSAGRIHGCGFDQLYAVELPSLTARPVAVLSQRFNGLTFAPAGMFGTGEALIGTANSDGALHVINVDTGTTQRIGAFGGTWIGAGDLVAVAGVGIYATLRPSPTGRDHLALVDPVTGAATIVGAGVGHPNVWGLGFWGGVLYGFNSFGSVLVVDRDTGHGTAVLELPEARFWGAGVTPYAKSSQ